MRNWRYSVSHYNGATGVWSLKELTRYPLLASGCTFDFRPKAVAFVSLNPHSTPYGSGA